jgi:hypothetical protein|tara:strand:- start:343 stop:720 length:378 start_codon:yes stop_codon:yes gene_type:complete
MGTDNKDKELKYCEWCGNKTSMGKTTQAETPILEFIEDKIDEIGREEVWGVHGDWSTMDIDSDFEAELLVYDEMLNTIDKRIVCEVCMRQDDEMYMRYYSEMEEEIVFEMYNPEDDDDIYFNPDF